MSIDLEKSISDLEGDLEKSNVFMSKTNVWVCNIQNINIVYIHIYIYML